METAAHRGDRVVGVETRRAADGHDVHRPMGEERVDRVVGDAAMRVCQPRDLLAVRAADRGNLDTGDGPRGAGVGVADVARAEQADSHGLPTASRCFRCGGS